MQCNSDIQNTIDGYPAVKKLKMRLLVNYSFSQLNELFCNAIANAIAIQQPIDNRDVKQGFMSKTHMLCKNLSLNCMK